MLRFESVDINKVKKDSSAKQEMVAIEDVIIIGSGPAGFTAAIYSVMSGYSTLLLEGLEPGGQLTTTTEVFNFPGFKDGIDGMELMTNMKHQSINLGVKTSFEEVLELEKKDDVFFVSTEKFIYKSKALIIATGASAKKLLTLKNLDTFWGKGISACATCDGHLFKGKTVAVIGGGDTALEEASYLSRMCEKVYIFVRKSSLKAMSMLKNKISKLNNVEILYNTEAIEANGEMSVSSVKIINNINNSPRDLALDGIFFGIGHTPNTDFLKGFIDLDENGYILVKDFVKTNVNGVFSCGDVSDTMYRQAITAAASGCMAVFALKEYLT